ncbi:hypothetical protein FGO68_gene7039 [Halteria grandinella]|uniref:Uncharacterized protein n=1 Tax=Halteria grandinella TaxID=5974 RepID=A0A8J8T0X7_HALGN|nr:hypothetical protein FGO68_gene7039 [Halteria grandinella]
MLTANSRNIIESQSIIALLRLRKHNKLCPSVAICLNLPNGKLSFIVTSIDDRNWELLLYQLMVFQQKQVDGKVNQAD